MNFYYAKANGDKIFGHKFQSIYESQNINKNGIIEYE